MYFGGITFTQERLSKLHGSQCGYCTPGIVMSMYALLRNNPTPDLHSVENNFDGMYLSLILCNGANQYEGNLCRCTGYRPILDAYKTVSVC